MPPKKNKSNERGGDFETYVRNTLVGIQIDITEINCGGANHTFNRRKIAPNHTFCHFPHFNDLLLTRALIISGKTGILHDLIMILMQNLKLMNWSQIAIIVIQVSYSFVLLYAVFRNLSA